MQQERGDKGGGGINTYKALLEQDAPVFNVSFGNKREKKIKRHKTLKSGELSVGENQKPAIPNSLFDSLFSLFGSHLIALLLLFVPLFCPHLCFVFLVFNTFFIQTRGRFMLWSIRL